MTATNEVAVAMPLGRLSPWFEEAFDSILSQSYETPIHFIANGLTDKENQILKVLSRKRSSIFVHEFSERLNMVSNWNRMFQVVDCKYLAILHDDDLFEPWLISSMLRATKEIPNCGIYFSRERIINGEGHFCSESEVRSQGIARLLNADEILDWAISNKICATGFLIDLEKTRSISGFNESVEYSPDWDLYFRLGASFQACFVDLHGGRYRLGSSTGQLSSVFARQGGSVTAYRSQQLLNLSHLGISPDSCWKRLDMGLSNQAKTVLTYFGADLDVVGRKTIREAIRKGLLSKYLPGLRHLPVPQLFESLADKLIDYKYPLLRS